MSRPGIEPGPPAREASTLEKSHLDSLFAGYSEPLLGLRWRSVRGLYSLKEKFGKSESQRLPDSANRGVPNSRLTKSGSGHGESRSRY